MRASCFHTRRTPALNAGFHSATAEWVHSCRRGAPGSCSSSPARHRRATDNGQIPSSQPSSAACDLRRCAAAKMAASSPSGTWYHWAPSASALRCCSRCTTWPVVSRYPRCRSASRGPCTTPGGRGISRRARRTAAVCPRGVCSALRGLAAVTEFSLPPGVKNGPRSPKPLTGSGSDPSAGEGNRSGPGPHRRTRELARGRCRNHRRHRRCMLRR